MILLSHLLPAIPHTTDSVRRINQEHFEEKNFAKVPA